MRRAVAPFARTGRSADTALPMEKHREGSTVGTRDCRRWLSVEIDFLDQSQGNGPQFSNLAEAQAVMGQCSP